MPRPRKYISGSDRDRAFLENHPDYHKNYAQENGDRLREIKREWAKANRPECPTCTLCGARLKSASTRAAGICRACRRKGKV